MNFDDVVDHVQRRLQYATNLADRTGLAFWENEVDALRETLDKLSNPEPETIPVQDAKPAPAQKKRGK